MTHGDHPFSIALNDLTIDELDKRYSEIMGRFNIARRMNMDQYVIHQLDLLLTSIEMEKERRAMVDEKAPGSIIDTDPIDLKSNIMKRK